MATTDYQIWVWLCGGCKEPKDSTQFYTAKNNPFKRTNYWCKACCKKARDKNKERNNEWLQARRNLHRERICDYLSTHPCIDCSESNILCLDFDHIQGDKVLEVTSMLGHAWASIEREIKKCEVVCANCHRIRTAKRSNYRYKLVYLAVRGQGV